MFASLIRGAYLESRFGQARILTIGVGSTDNSAALRVGRYMFRVTAGSIHVRGPQAADTLATTTDMIHEAGDIFYVDIGTEAAEQFVSLIRDGAADATVYVCGVSGDAPVAQPPTWT